MIVAAKLEMSDFEQALDMKVVDWAIFQAASEGLEYGRPKLRDVRFTFFDSKLIPYFFEWAKSGNSKRSGKIHYISSDMAKVEYCFSFKDAVCSGCYVHFIANEELPLYCDVSLSVSLEKQDLVKGKGEKAKKIVPAPIEGGPINTVNEPAAPKVLDLHYESLDGVIWNNWIDHGEFMLCLKSENAVGKSFSSTLDFPNKAIEYQGKGLENNKLENIVIRSDEMKLKLKSKIKTKKQ